MVGAAMCVAMSQATDLMLDLKTGYLVGATPRMQQIGQFCGAWLGPIVVIGVIFVLNESTALAATSCRHRRHRRWQARSTASWVATCRPRNTRRAPSGRHPVGRHGWSGHYGRSGFLPAIQHCPDLFAGHPGRELSDRIKGKTWSEEVGIPIAAGLIVGEALVGVGDALSIVLTS